MHGRLFFTSAAVCIAHTYYSTYRKPPTKPHVDPFATPDPALLIAHVGSRHFVVLNKFIVAPHHVIVATSEFESQESLLTASDFAATWEVLRVGWQGNGEWQVAGGYSHGAIVSSCGVRT